MLKRLTAFCLLVSLIGSYCSSYFVYAGFELNQKYISKSLCVNKSKPWMHCNGRCYLMKKLKQTEEKEKKAEQQEQKSRYQENLPAEPLTLTLLTQVIKAEYPPSLTPGITDQPSSIFQPPRV
ncbi:hypothetical protein [Mucilaginibacter psychrotolerans]|uniref:Uncharacterized protein n=1 Tax=Mucilaginibacter psychrotolerans TaxID=1524096 RepID=A0A4Y8SM49_9SPHI|nr:hypothetical protein [Mucilaginibacter psychrotolerans]TFF39720.1 hypothetical protein E2R66_04970 [Mucilaginibacter psychrotolerans]